MTYGFDQMESKVRSGKGAQPLPGQFLTIVIEEFSVTLNG